MQITVSRGSILILGLVVILLLVATAVDSLGPAASGVQSDFIAIEWQGRYYETRRGGGPIEDRQLREITAHQYAIYQMYERAAGAIVALGAVLLIVFIVIRTFHEIAKRQRGRRGEGEEGSGTSAPQKGERGCVSGGESPASRGE